MKVEMLESKWGGDIENLSHDSHDYHVTLYKMSDDGREWYRINIEDSLTAKFARREFEGNMARDMAQNEFDKIVYGEKTPLQYAWM